MDADYAQYEYPAKHLKFPKKKKRESTNPILFDQDDKDGIILTAGKIKNLKNFCNLSQPFP